MLKTMKKALVLGAVGALTGCGASDDELVEVSVEIGEAEQAVIILPNDFGKVKGREATDNSRCRHSPKNYTNSFCLIPKYGGPGACPKIRINHPAGVATAEEREAIDFGIQMSTNQGFPHTCWMPTTGNDWQIRVTSVSNVLPNGGLGSTRAEYTCFGGCKNGNIYHYGQGDIRIDVANVRSACAVMALDSDECLMLFNQTAIHEMGHARGLGHTTETGISNMMWNGVTSENWDQLIYSQHDVNMLNTYDYNP